MQTGLVCVVYPGLKYTTPCPRRMPICGHRVRAGPQAGRSVRAGRQAGGVVCFSTRFQGLQSRRAAGAFRHGASHVNGLTRTPVKRRAACQTEKEHRCRADRPSIGQHRTDGQNTVGEAITPGAAVSDAETTGARTPSLRSWKVIFGDLMGSPTADYEAH